MGDYVSTYRGVVLDTSDPMGSRRVNVMVPDVSGPDGSWALPEHADAALPNIGDEVSVRYENGDPNFPIWTADAAVAGSPAAGAGGYPGTYRGVVVDNADPYGLGRLNIQVPEVLGVESTWATPEHAPPQVGAEVWVRFEGGDPQHPVWSA
jgi:hypothetical protein